MNKVLDTILTELNPVHDYDNIKFHDIPYNATPQEQVKLRLKNYKFLPGIIKPIGRGGLVGGTIGAIVNYISGNSIDEGFRAGLYLGANLDVCQYMTRGVFKYFKAQFPSRKE